MNASPIYHDPTSYNMLLTDEKRCTSELEHELEGVSISKDGPNSTIASSAFSGTLSSRSNARSESKNDWDPLFLPGSSPSHDDNGDPVAIKKSNELSVSQGYSQSISRSSLILKPSPNRRRHHLRRRYAALVTSTLFSVPTSPAVPQHQRPPCKICKIKVGDTQLANREIC